MRLWLVVLLLGWVRFAGVAQEFEIKAIENDGTIRWQLLDGHVYTVQTREGLAGLWEPVPPEEQWPITTAEWLVNGGVGWPMVAQRFYRVMAEPSACPPEGMVLIPAGTFTMGDSTGDGYSNELPLHAVTLSAFYMGVTQTTKEQWDEVYDWAVSREYSFDNAGSGKGATHPLHSANWYDMLKWCNARSENEGMMPCYYTNVAKTPAFTYRSGRVDIRNDWVLWDVDGYRLPTEAEWEYAARGGAVGKRFPWSDTDHIAHSRANYRASADEPYDDSSPAGFHPDYEADPEPYTSPVGSFAPNDYGLHDMTGNVWDWCWDWYGASYYSSSPAQDPRGPTSGVGRVSRGGSWDASARPCRVANRKLTWHGGDWDHVGFRAARSAP